MVFRNGMELKLAHHQLGHITGTLFTDQALGLMTLSKTQNEVTAQIKSSWGHIGANVINGSPVFLIIFGQYILSDFQKSQF